MNATRFRILYNNIYSIRKIDPFGISRVPFELDLYIAKYFEVFAMQFKLFRSRFVDFLRSSINTHIHNSAVISSALYSSHTSLWLFSILVASGTSCYCSPASLIIHRCYGLRRITTKSSTKMFTPWLAHSTLFKALHCSAVDLYSGLSPFVTLFQRRYANEFVLQLF